MEPGDIGPRHLGDLRFSQGRDDHVLKEPAVLLRGRGFALRLRVLCEEPGRKIGEGRGRLHRRPGTGRIAASGYEPEKSASLIARRLRCPGSPMPADGVPASPPVNVVFQHVGDRVALLPASMEPWRRAGPLIPYPGTGLHRPDDA